MAYENSKIIKSTIITTPGQCKPGCLRIKLGCAHDCRR